MWRFRGVTRVELQRNVGLVEPWQSVRSQEETRSRVLVTYAVDYLDPLVTGMGAGRSCLGNMAMPLMCSFADPACEAPGCRNHRPVGPSSCFCGSLSGISPRGLALGENPNRMQWPSLAACRTPRFSQGALEEHRRISEGLDVDSTPIVWINGYRLMGVRQLALLQHYVDLALADLDGTRP